MAEPPKLITSNVGHPTPKFVFDPPVRDNTQKSERDSSPNLKTPKISTSQPTSPKSSSSQPSSPKQLASSKQTSSQPTSPKLSVLKPASQAAALKNALKSPSQGAQLSGSATGNPRNKCALQPGHSLMDWIRFGNSGKDLTGVGGRLRAVSAKELAQHNTQEDAWLAVRGRVYNVTHYLPYHPGGPDELLRGAGIDATALFDKVHPWVNYESLLGKCLVGPLSSEQVDAHEFFGESAPTPKSSDRLREPSKAQELVRKSMENLANCITPVRKRISAKSADADSVKSGDSNCSKIMQSLIHSSELPLSISRRAGSSPVREAEGGVAPAPPAPPAPPVRFDWIQTSSRLTLSLYTRALANPGARARLAADGALAVDVAHGDARSRLTLLPERPLRAPLLLRVYPESGKVEVSARKIESGVWRSAGETHSEHLGAEEGAAARRVFRVRRRENVSHDTVLLVLEPAAAAAAAEPRGPAHVAAVLPIGLHVKVHANINGTEVVRSYTPVSESWAAAAPPSGAEERTPCVCLAVKRYSAGTLTPMLTALPVDEPVTMSGPYGNFELHRLKKSNRLYLVAAGTGITPMLNLLSFMLARRNPRCDSVHLLFFNKKAEDILFNEKFAEISESDKRFQVTNVLSEAGASWAGLRGRVRTELLERAFGASSLRCGGREGADACAHFAAACGPAEFTHRTEQLLSQLGLTATCFHSFLG